MNMCDSHIMVLLNDNKIGFKAKKHLFILFKKFSVFFFQVLHNANATFAQSIFFLCELFFCRFTLVEYFCILVFSFQNITFNHSSMNFIDSREIFFVNFSFLLLLFLLSSQFWQLFCKKQKQLNKKQSILFYSFFTFCYMYIFFSEKNNLTQMYTRVWQSFVISNYNISFYFKYNFMTAKSSASGLQCC